MTKEKYRFRETPDSVRIRPFWGRIYRILITVILAAVAVAAIQIQPFEDSESVRVISFAIAFICVAVFLYDILFLIHIELIFDRRSRAIYRKHLLWPRQKLMDFDEMQIITTSEYGTWAYAIGQRKKQLIKNYAISQSFSGSTKENRKVLRYQEEILRPILDLLKDETEIGKIQDPYSSRSK